jgi:hypothetical protein
MLVFGLNLHTHSAQHQASSIAVDTRWRKKHEQRRASQRRKEGRRSPPAKCFATPVSAVRDDHVYELTKDPES